MAGPNAGPGSLSALVDLVPYAAAAFAAADVDVRDLINDKLPARYIAARSAGTLEIVTARGNTRTFTVTDGWERVVQYVTITTNTTVDVEVGY